jgi:hypothetical protein
VAAVAGVCPALFDNGTVVSFDGVLRPIVPFTGTGVCVGVNNASPDGFDEGLRAGVDTYGLACAGIDVGLEDGVGVGVIVGAAETVGDGVTVGVGVGGLVPTLMLSPNELVCPVPEVASTVYEYVPGAADNGTDTTI